jgi:hypothetical protein
MNKKGISTVVLNGWQRLWILLSLLLAVISISVVASNWPKESDLTEARAVYAVNLGLQAVALKAKQAGNERDELEALRALKKGAPSVRENDYGALSAADLLTKIRPVLQNTRFADELTLREALDKEKVFDLRKESILKGLLIWLGIVSSTYAVGWGIFWVRSGFKNPT